LPFDCFDIEYPLFAVGFYLIIQEWEDGEGEVKEKVEIFKWYDYFE